MVKTILILDKMPKCCLGCPCGNGEIYQYIDCKATGKRIHISVGFHERPDDCPLEEMPLEYTMEDIPDDLLRRLDPADVKAILAGWNACVETIGGERDAD